MKGVENRDSAMSLLKFVDKREARRLMRSKYHQSAHKDYLQAASTSSAGKISVLGSFFGGKEEVVAGAPDASLGGISVAAPPTN